MSVILGLAGFLFWVGMKLVVSVTETLRKPGNMLSFKQLLQNVYSPQINQ